MVDNYTRYLQSTSRVPRPISSKLCFVASEHGIREELIIVRRNSYRTVGDSKYFTTLLLSTQHSSQDSLQKLFHRRALVHHCVQTCLCGLSCGIRLKTV